MAKSVVGIFDQRSEAERAVRDLIDNGFRRDDISFIAGHTSGEPVESTTTSSEGMSSTVAGASTGAVVGGLGGLLVGLGVLAIPGVGPVLAAGPLAVTLLGAGVGAAAGGLIGSLMDVGVPEEEAGYYAEGIRRGSTLVAVNTDDEMMIDRAVNIFERHNAVDIDRRVEEWRKSGWTGYDPNATTLSTETPVHQAAPKAAPISTSTTLPTPPPRTAPVSTTTRQANEKTTAIPVVEEELQIGKRAVPGGTVRVYSRMVEKPVQEQVQLREEHVRVERHPVNRPASEADLTTFKEGVVEVHETREEAVVAKQARVVEEVVVSKEVNQRTETVRDKARRTEVEVEKMGPTAGAQTSSYDVYTNDFRGNFNTLYGNRGYTYERYEPAYRYGYTLANDKRYTGKDWAAIESDVQRDWETNHKGTWQEFKDSIRYGWERVKGYSPAEASARTTARNYEDYTDDFRGNFNTLYGNRGHTYERYEPAYRYGYMLAGDRRYAGKDWSAIEPDVQRDWERNNKGTWQEVKESIRYAWERVKGYSPSEASARSGSRAA